MTSNSTPSFTKRFYQRALIAIKHIEFNVLEPTPQEIESLGYKTFCQHFPEYIQSYGNVEISSDQWIEFNVDLLDKTLRTKGYPGLNDPGLTDRMLHDLTISLCVDHESLISEVVMNCIGDGRTDKIFTVIEVLNFVFEVINKLKDEKSISRVSAGPLEDLFRYHSDEIYNTLDEMLKKSINMRKALQGVWCHSDPALLKKIKKLLDKHHLKYASL